MIDIASFKQLALWGSQRDLTSTSRGLSVDTMNLKKANGVVYTPPKLADYLAGKLTDFVLGDVSDVISTRNDPRDGQTLRILDPACGQGDLLISLWNQLRRQARQFGFDQKVILRAPEEVLCGIDIDSKAIRRTRDRIASLSENGSLIRKRFNLLSVNALFPVPKTSSVLGWESILTAFDARKGFDIIIANPPWGANVNPYKRDLDRGDFSLYQGQFDTSDLFVELAVRLLKPGGYLAFIVPDSLFSHERRALRKVLLEQTEIRFIARLGERIFEKVNRACALIICKKGPDGRRVKTECLRLTPPLRKKILDGTIDFADAEQRLSHRIPQKRFLNNRDHLFDIDITSREEVTLHAFYKLRGRFGDYLKSTRGIELSKRGKVYQCERCQLWLPLPIRVDANCPHCKIRLSLSRKRISSIVSSDHKHGFKPMFVGEDVRRYHLNSGFWINTKADGINYKQKDTFEGPKLLVRKTGVGISAAIDYSNSYTNQVVYIFRVKDGVPSQIPLEVFLAILNSRLIYYYLVKNHGETEWRSHPYITQNQIMDFPIPDMASLQNGSKNLVIRLSNVLAKYTYQNLNLPPKVDARVERMVAALYGMNRAHYETIYRTLEGVEELLPVRVLKKITVADIFPGENA